MPNIALSEARVKALRPRPSAYDIRDAKLRSFGVRVLPSGARRFFIHTQHRGTRVWKMVGDASAMNVDEARTRAASLLAAIRCDADAPASPDATRFEAVAETVFQRCARVWKPRTLYVNRNYLHRQILPRFAGMQIADITRADVQRWFASRRATAPRAPIPAGEYDAIAARDANAICPMRRLAALRQHSRCTRANGRFRWPQFDCFCSRGAARARCSPFAGPTTARATCSCATARPGRGRCG